MEAITRSDISCKDCAETVNLIIKKLGQPIMTNLYYNTVKMLLERMSSVMIDKANLKVFFIIISLVNLLGILFLINTIPIFWTGFNIIRRGLCKKW